jgi:predicted transcriptional regulator
MSRIERLAYDRLNTLYQHQRDYVRTVALVPLLGGKNERTIREWLSRLESAGYVQRRGQRGGWKPVGMS